MVILFNYFNPDTFAEFFRFQLVFKPKVKLVSIGKKMASNNYK